MITLTKKLTYQDFLLFPDDRNRHELIDGEHVMSPSPNYFHQKTSRDLEFQFHSYFRKNNNGEILYAPMDVYFSDIDIVEPDLIVIAEKNRDIIKKRFIKGSPDIVIEILSNSTKKNDLILKKDLYEKYKVKEYWVIDCDLEIVQKYILEGNYFVDGGIFKDFIETPIFPDLKINLKEIFE